MDKRIWIICLIMFINLLGVGIIFPLLPYYAESMGASIIMIGFLGTMYPLFQIFSAPILGNLSDRIGRRPVLLFSLLGTTLGFLILGDAKSLVWLFIARIVDGASAGNTPTAYAYVADITTEQNRTRGMTRISSAIWLGFVFGPAAGGILSHFGYSAPAFAAAIVSAFGLLLTYKYLPETVHKPKIAEGYKFTFSLRRLEKIANHKPLTLIIIISLLFETAFWLMDSTLSLFLQHRFHFSSVLTGFLFTYFAVVGILMQTMIAKHLLRMLSEYMLLFIAGTTSAISLFILAYSTSIASLMLADTIIACSVSMIHPLLVSLVSKLAEKGEQGNTIGTKDAVDTIATLIGPVIGTTLFSFNSGLPYITGGVICFAAIIIVLLTKYKFRKSAVSF